MRWLLAGLLKNSGVPNETQFTTKCDESEQRDRFNYRTQSATIPDPSKPQKSPRLGSIASRDVDAVISTTKVYRNIL